MLGIDGNGQSTNLIVTVVRSDSHSLGKSYDPLIPQEIYVAAH